MDISCLASSFGLQPVSTTKACCVTFFGQVHPCCFLFFVCLNKNSRVFAVSLGVWAMGGQFQ